MLIRANYGMARARRRALGVRLAILHAVACRWGEDTGGLANVPPANRGVDGVPLRCGGRAPARTRPMPGALSALRGGMHSLAREDMHVDEDDFLCSADIENEPRWHRPVRIGHSGVVQSIRVIPADPGVLLGGRAQVPDLRISEWFWADSASSGAARSSAEAPVLRVPDDVQSVHRAVSACPVGGVVSVGQGLFRWDGLIKLRKGLPPVPDAADAHSPRPRPSATNPDAGGSPGSSSGGIHVRGVEGSVLLGQWLLGRSSAGSLLSIGLAGNFSVLYEVVLDVHAGPWAFEDIECRCVGGGLVRVCEWGEVDSLNCGRWRMVRWRMVRWRMVRWRMV
jgi:hypothetical protein